MIIEWDDEKERRNRAKHEISFDAAALVFADPFAITKFDRIVADEERWQTVGMSTGLAVLLVVHTEREESDEEIIRIISARRATRTERREYEENRAKAR